FQTHEREHGVCVWTTTAFTGRDGRRCVSGELHASYDKSEGCDVVCEEPTSDSVSAEANGFCVVGWKGGDHLASRRTDQRCDDDGADAGTKDRQSRYGTCGDATRATASAKHDV